MHLGKGMHLRKGMPPEEGRPPDEGRAKGPDKGRRGRRHSQREWEGRRAGGTRQERQGCLYLGPRVSFYIKSMFLRCLKYLFYYVI